jgi:quinol monooxygenase YgiN
VTIKPGTEKDYEAAVAKAVALPPIEGFYGFELHRSIEKPLRYRVIARCDSVEAHNAFRSSKSFAEWRALVGPYYAGPPEIEHTETGSFDVLVHHCAIPMMSGSGARNGHVESVAQCPLLGAKRKTCARIELFRF